jgi:hypothetical protein
MSMLAANGFGSEPNQKTFECLQCGHVEKPNARAKRFRLRRYGVEQFSPLPVVSREARNMAKRPANERVELEMKIIRYRELLRRGVDPETTRRFETAVAELEQKLREIDE